MAITTYYPDGMIKYTVINGYEHYNITDQEIEHGKELQEKGAFVKVRVPCTECKNYTAVSLHDYLDGQTNARHTDSYHEAMDL